MVPVKIRIGVVLICFLLCMVHARADSSINERRIELAMRMIGHQVLENSGDLTSRILPVTHELNRYRIVFGSDFQLNADALVNTVNRVMELTGISNHYMVEVETCSTKEIVYSFEVNRLSYQDITPCQTREQPFGCYTILVTLLDQAAQSNEVTRVSENPEETHSGSASTWLFAISAGVVALFFFFRWYRGYGSRGSDTVRIGLYRYDKRQMELSLKNERVELTGKEADLLLLLYEAVNTTVERDTILRSVWGDEGDYIGRTLDVFISRLRKKLEGDPDVRILNIRGVGYRLVLSGSD